MTVQQEPNAAEEGLASPLLVSYQQRERRAILAHKYYLGIELEHDPGLVSAIASWESRFASQWRRERHLLDCQEQIARIERYRCCLSRGVGVEVSWEAAARSWISRHAAHWRSTCER